MRSLVIKCTAGAEDPERCNQAFTVAAAGVAAGAQVSLWLTGEAAWFGVPGRAEDVRARPRHSPGRAPRHRPGRRHPHGLQPVRPTPRPRPGRPGRRNPHRRSRRLHRRSPGRNSPGPRLLTLEGGRIRHHQGGRAASKRAISRDHPDDERRPQPTKVVEQRAKRAISRDHAVRRTPTATTKVVEQRAKRVISRDHAVRRTPTATTEADLNCVRHPLASSTRCDLD